MRKYRFGTFIALALIAMVGLAGCGSSKELYSWYGYEEKSYEWEKKQTPKSEEKLLREYARIIQEPKGTRKTPPPGICAEYGYVLLKQGKKEEGLALLKREIELYPESANFIGRIIKQFEK